MERRGDGMGEGRGRLTVASGKRGAALNTRPRLGEHRAGNANNHPCGWVFPREGLALA